MARSFFNKAIRSLRRRVRYNLYWRAIVWKYWQRQCPGKPIIVRLDRNLKVRVYPHDVIGKYIYIDGVFEPEVWRFVKSYLKPGMIVFDLGSNLGQYTLLAAKCVGEKGKVYSFEPSGRMFIELEFNVALNNLSDTCILNKAAVSDVSGTAKLSKYEPGAEVYNSLGSHTRKERAKVGCEEVKTIRLDDYVKEMGVGHVDFMKIDIEGAELLALRGAENLLLRSDAPVILLELDDVNTEGFGYAAVEIWDYLKSLGYRMYSLGRHRSGPEMIERPDKLALSQNLVAVKAISE
ncbi:MAG: FkbM family methyltransferase [Desulfobacteraceae bacterium]|nr:FkbM family methyltransferase [Desulfobacteraceae bacterium]